MAALDEIDADINLRDSKRTLELTRGRVNSYMIEGRTGIVYVDSLTRKFVSTEYAHALINRVLKIESRRKISK